MSWEVKQFINNVLYNHKKVTKDNNINASQPRFKSNNFMKCFQSMSTI